MSVCPFCKKPVPSAHGPCPFCGRFAADHPSLQQSAGRTFENAWGDEEIPAGAFELSSGSVGQEAGQGGGTAFGAGGRSLSDDDPFAEETPAGMLELDVPDHHPSNRSMAVGTASPSLEPQRPPS